MDGQGKGADPHRGRRGGRRVHERDGRKKEICERGRVLYTSHKAATEPRQGALPEGAAPNLKRSPPRWKQEKAPVSPGRRLFIKLLSTLTRKSMLLEDLGHNFDGRQWPWPDRGLAKTKFWFLQRDEACCLNPSILMATG